MLPDYRCRSGILSNPFRTLPTCHSLACIIKHITGFSADGGIGIIDTSRDISGIVKTGPGPLCHEASLTARVSRFLPNFLYNNSDNNIGWLRKASIICIRVVITYDFGMCFVEYY